MADPKGSSSLANILGYIWTLVLAFFVGKTTSARSELPLDVTRRSSRVEVQQTLRSSEYVIEKEGYEKTRFLRHPSLRSKRKGRKKDTNTETRRGSSLSTFPSASSIPYLNSFVHRPRAASTTIPLLIVTPSTPTRAVFPVAECLLPSLSSPLELANATTEPSQHLPISVKQSVAEDTGEVSLSLEKPDFVSSLDVENGSCHIEFDSWTMSAGQASLGGSEAAEPSFFLPESLQKITLEPIRCASHALSAVSDMLSDVPVWSVGTLGVGVPSYFTSTPPKRRRSAGLRDIENNYVETLDPHDSPSHDTFYHYVDLIPYPDVFDLDMYSIPLKKKIKNTYGRDCTFRNTFSLENDGLTDPPPCERRTSDDYKEKSRVTVSPVVSSSSHVTYHERGDNIHQSPSTPRSISDNTSSPRSQQQHRISLHNSSNLRYITPLDDSTNTSLRNSPTSVMTSPSSTLYSIEKSNTTTGVKSQREPIRSVRALTDSRSSPSSHCPQRSRTSSDSEPESDAGSMDALKARLREACDDFSTSSPFTEEIEIWEPVTF